MDILTDTYYILLASCVGENQFTLLEVTHCCARWLWWPQKAKAVFLPILCLCLRLYHNAFVWPCNLLLSGGVPYVDQDPAKGAPSSAPQDVFRVHMPTYSLPSFSYGWGLWWGVAWKGILDFFLPRNNFRNSKGVSFKHLGPTYFSPAPLP